WFGGRSAVHDNAHDFFADNFFIAKNFDGVAVALAHLLAIGPRHDGDFVANLRLRDDEGLAILFVELDGDVARDFHVLLLVAAYGHNVRIVDQDVGGHEDWISKEAVTGGNTASELVFITGAALQQTHGRNGGEHPGELGHFGDVGLAKEDRFFRIESASQKIECDVESIF